MAKRITAPTGAFYVDNLEYINPADRGAVINCIPGGGETDVAKDVAIYLHLVSFENAALGGDARVYITPSSTGVQTLAYDQGAGGFQAGFSGIATVRQSPGAVVDDELVLVFQRSTSFASLETVLLEVYGSVQGFGSFSSTYGFTIEDYTAPSIFEVLWLTPKKVRVKFSEDMEMGTDSDSALFYRNYNGGVELIAPNKIKLQGAELSSLWSSLRVGVAGSTYPQNNGYHEIASVDTTNSELTVSSAILDDDGIDLNEAGIIADRRTLIAVVSPYVLSPRLSDEGATDPPQSASRIQCAYCPIVVATSQPAAEELPSGASLLQYVYLDLHDDISRSRLYRLAGYGAQDVWDNAMSGEYLDFQAPSFQLPSNRVGLWSVGIIPGSDQEEDLGDEGQLRRMAVVLQDVLDLLWHKAYQVQFVEDPFRCPAHLLDYLLYDLGNPFRFPLETELIKRKLAAALHGFYQKVGTKQGIKNMIFTLLGMQITIQAYVTEGGWLLGDATYGLLGDTTYLGPSGTFAKNCYEILTPRVITAAELRIIRDVATWADPPNMHLVRIIENVAGGTEYDTTDLDLSAGNVSP
uniref:Putative tail protein n=1 Tax=viral metagenome TaxID=1070528 RepID=A0A6M3X744_9ZZZZ